jgi:hypothetical protein
LREGVGRDAGRRSTTRGKQWRSSPSNTRSSVLTLSPLLSVSHRTLPPPSDASASTCTSCQPGTQSQWGAVGAHRTVCVGEPTGWAVDGSGPSPDSEVPRGRLTCWRSMPLQQSTYSAASHRKVVDAVGGARQSAHANALKDIGTEGSTHATHAARSRPPCPVWKGFRPKLTFAHPVLLP